MDPQLLSSLWTATLETLYMVSVSAVLAALFGLPLGLLLVITAPKGFLPNPALNQSLGSVVNAGRSVPFIILLVAIIPLTRLIVGTTIGSTAALVPLTLSAIPFYARVAETSLLEVDRGLVEAAESMGCSYWQVIAKVLIPEALPSLVLGLTIMVISLIGYSAMAGVVGGGGLGDLAIRYGYQRFNTQVMLITVVLLIVLVQVVQWVGDAIARQLRRR
ncbi:methionine ABC transporter permease [Pseudanabaena sp. FACHB-2040]|uniref:methionine ABC transporter permease n=1 Tax=Pseudanabaena sp. FACHB-2040 TaxID=2692859 RepID=UPI0016820145|nr:methionine ABC transporter permease [Pseudanabaena sp. FACHB-2040]MBD2256088.1 ABC transporter permease [Pseudanabaena sp. FACHB-2040]